MTKLKTLTLTTLAFLALGLIGCDTDNTVVYETVVEDAVPATPQGLFSITGDGAVYLYFNGIYETDVDYYVIYRSLSATTGYTERGTVAAAANPNLDLYIYEYIDNSVTNGVTYYYAVTAVDEAGQESDLSAEDVFDTPRPEGQATLFPNDVVPGQAGYNLATATELDWTLSDADIWIDRIADVDGVTFYSFINAGNEWTDIQDLGYTESFDDITYAPTDGWSRLGYVEVLVGHTYVVWDQDNHYTKIRINSMTQSGAFSFTWGYQVAEGNLQLAPPVRPERAVDYPAPKPGKSAILLK